MLLLRDILRPSAPQRGVAGGGGGDSGPAHFLCLACVSRARERSDHALATLKLAR